MKLLCDFSMNDDFTMNPQFTYDKQGRAVGVFLPIEDWELLTQNFQASVELPQWQREILDHRILLLKQNPADVTRLDDFIAEMESEADEEV